MSGSVLTLPARVTIVEVGQVHDLAKAALAVDATLSVDGSSVREIDTAGLQLLTALWQSARLAGGRCEWLDPPPDCVRRAAKLIGVAGVLCP